MRRSAGVLPLIATLICLSFFYHTLYLQGAAVVQRETERLDSPSHSSQQVDQLQKRIQQLETKLNTYMAFDSDPFLNNKITSFCPNRTNLSEYCNINEPDPRKKKTCAMGDMKLCLSDIRQNDCIVYDFGIRNEPDFGVILSKEPFNCKVFAFDPSPITRAWFDKNKALQQLNNYRLFYYGGGAHDESIILREYDWGQVSVYQYPSSIVNASDCHKGNTPLAGKCEATEFHHQKLHLLPVRSVPSIMKELGHNHIDVLKLDVEGSEYKMLETLISSGACQRVGQMTLEWHHFGWDIRYGHGSDPHLNVLHRLLMEECGLHQFSVHSPTGWPSNEKMFVEMQLPLYYNLAAFRRQS